jgi:hypothetical protein
LWIPHVIFILLLLFLYTLWSPTHMFLMRIKGITRRTSEEISSELEVEMDKAKQRKQRLGQKPSGEGRWKCWHFGRAMQTLSCPTRLRECRRIEIIGGIHGNLAQR